MPKKTHIYYTEVYEISTTRVIDQRVSCHPNQYQQLVNRYGDENVVCRRMDLGTGEWSDYPGPDKE